ncbi:hypothetical protein AMJ40_03415 [candidate division TA06 bacterium DG_26]|uniref:Uncharacterized protein n=1 Tax=candidate division TA06 bacterium DG_26 TaxID=1703771 RepID=A0A0S7WJN0_UNCT6|nr:MAG: hypothetical protein AMJ40_03415 [candidate division TA06 bacterium DG_26]
MHMRTGETAGEIWRILEAKGPLTLGKLTQAVRKDTKTMLRLATERRQDLHRRERKRLAYFAQIR